MNNHHLYLLLDLGAISIPLLASFYPKARFISSWRRIVPAIFIPMLLFILWDVWFTHIGVWGFNQQYLTGLYFLLLPVEEWLFFICIPYACLFTYFAFKHFIKMPNARGWEGYSLGVISMITGIIFYENAYTSATFIGLGGVLIYIGWSKWPYLLQFLVSFLIILVPFFLLNGILTGSWMSEPVVWYNDQENLGIRIGTIPLEDAFYGMFLLLFNTLIWETKKLSGVVANAHKS